MARSHQIFTEYIGLHLIEFVILLLVGRVSVEIKTKGRLVCC